jgi:hypothetical protein
MGFSTIVWNESSNEAEMFVSIEVQSEELVQDFKKAAIGI